MGDGLVDRLKPTLRDLAVLGIGALGGIGLYKIGGGYVSKKFDEYRNGLIEGIAKRVSEYQHE